MNMVLKSEDLLEHITKFLSIQSINSLNLTCKAIHNIINYNGLQFKNMHSSVILHFLEYACKEGLFDLAVRITKFCDTDLYKLKYWNVNYMYNNINCLGVVSACKNGHLLIVKWLIDKFNIDIPDFKLVITEVLHYICLNGYYKIIAWLFDNNFINRVDGKVETKCASDACLSGCIITTQLVFTKFNILPDSEHFNSLLKSATVSKNIQLVKYIVCYFNIKLDISNTFMIISYVSTIEMLQWFIKEFNITKDNLLEDNYINLSTICDLPQCELFRYIFDKFELNQDNTSDYTFDTLSLLCSGSTLYNVKWFIDKLSITNEELHTNSDMILAAACANDDYFIVQWLCERCAFIRSDIINPEKNIMSGVSSQTICWLIEKFLMTEKEIINENILINSCNIGDFNLLKFLVDRFEFKPEEKNKALLRACSSGCLVIVQWLCQQYKQCQKIILVGLIHAGECGNLDIVRWFVETYHLTRKTEAIIECMIYACVNGYLKVAQLLVKSFNIVRGDICHESILLMSLHVKHIMTHHWLQITFNLNLEDSLFKCD